MTVAFTVEASVRHHVMVQGYASGEAKKTARRINRMMKKITGILAAPESLGTISLAASEWNRMQGVVEDAMDEFTDLSKKELVEFGLQEAKFYSELLEKASTVSAAGIATIGIPQINKILKKPMNLIGNEKLSMDAAVSQFSRKQAKNIKKTIQAGYLLGETNNEIVLKLNALAKTKSIPQAQTLTRTLINYMSSEARSENARANADIVEKEMYVSVLDDRTTLICASLDGTVLDIDEPPFTPRHWNCRSVRVAIVKPEFRVLGLDGTRSSFGDKTSGYESAKTTYGGFLRRQSVDFRKKVLGADRARLFDSGGLSIDKFTNDMGVPYSLKELKRRQPLAFEKAGLID